VQTCDRDKDREVDNGVKGSRVGRAPTRGARTARVAWGGAPGIGGAVLVRMSDVISKANGKLFSPMREERMIMPGDVR
jgi:hypothetical protein